MIEAVTTLYEDNQMILGLVALLSLIMFVGSLLSLPYLVSLIPADYFQYAEPYRVHHKFRHPVIRLIIIGLKNIIGWLLIIAGIAMLVSECTYFLPPA